MTWPSCRGRALLLFWINSRNQCCRIFPSSLCMCVLLCVCVLVCTSCGSTCTMTIPSKDEYWVGIGLFSLTAGCLGSLTDENSQMCMNMQPVHNCLISCFHSPDFKPQQQLDRPLTAGDKQPDSTVIGKTFSQCVSCYVEVQIPDFIKTALYTTS